MSEVPRKPAFPSYMVQKLIAKIQNEVEEDVIPVSTGIYSYEKLKNKLQAIPKPQIQNYEDQIFYEIIEDKLAVFDQTGKKCPTCEEQYNMKKNPAVMCNFCRFQCCSQCILVRKRPHPLSKDGSGKRYNICQRCDTKYLNLQLSHSYVQNRTLLDQAITTTSLQLESVNNQITQYEQVVAKSRRMFQKNKFKISQLRKEKLQLNKSIINKMPEQLRSQQLRNQELKVKFVNIHVKHKEWMDLNQEKKKKSQRLQQEQLRKFEQQQRLKIHQQKQQEIQREQTQRLEKQIKTVDLSQNTTYNLKITSQTEPNKKKSNQVGGYDIIRKQQSQSQQQYTRSRHVSQISAQKGDFLQGNPYNLKVQQKRARIPYSSYQQSQSQQQAQQQSPYNQSDYIHVSPKPQQSTQIAEPSVPVKQSVDFADYFAQQDHPYNTDNNQYETPIKQLYAIDSTQQASKSRQNQQITQDDKIRSYTFSESKIQHLQPAPAYNIISHKKSHHEQLGKSQNQCTFNEKGGLDYHKEQIRQVQVLHGQKFNQLTDLQGNDGQDQDNKLSFTEQWYVQKNNKQSSTLQSLLSQQYNMTKNKKQPEQLEEQCTKSTSQLDQDQLQVARYSLIKAARDKAVQERQKNKTYQNSVHQGSPFDQDNQGIGQVKKCQCSIY